jgi:hypothetical protein
MQRPSWASIVKKLPPMNTSQDEFIRFDDTIPATEVPEPIASVTQPNCRATVVDPPLNSELEQVEKRKDAISKLMDLKETAFHSSYAYTRYSEDIKKLADELTLLNTKEEQIRRSIILASGVYARQAKWVVQRISDYLGPGFQPHYSGYDGYKCMSYQIKLCTGNIYSFNSESGEGIRWYIHEGVNVDYEFPNKVHIGFTVQSEDMISVLDAAIKEKLIGFKNSKECPSEISMYALNSK